MSNYYSKNKTVQSHYNTHQLQLKEIYRGLTLRRYNISIM